MIENIYFNLRERFYEFFKIPKYVKFQELEIKVTPDHLLTYFRRKYPLYNEFLPIISKYLSKDTIFIDVGANCGDTLFSVFEKNNDLFFYCFEADKKFYEYLKFNRNKIGKTYKVDKIKLYNSFIGDKIKTVNLKGKYGTKKAHEKLDKNLPILKSKALDKFFLNEKKKISFLKTDVDGFDYDVLNSSMKTIRKHKPILFFECETNEKNLKNYLQVITKLKKLNYCHFNLFSNYGELKLSTEDINIVKKNIEIQFLNKKKRYFFDILMYTKKNKKIIMKAIKEFKKYD